MLNLTSEDVIISVDKQTDDKVQKAIKEEFRRATLFVIAHHLNVILGGRWVVVLEGGNHGCCLRGRAFTEFVSSDSLEAQGLCHHGIKVSALTSWDKILLQNAMRLVD
jgi:hypothetical protein